MPPATSGHDPEDDDRSAGRQQNNTAKHQRRDSEGDDRAAGRRNNGEHLFHGAPILSNWLAAAAGRRVAQVEDGAPLGAGAAALAGGGPAGRLIWLLMFSRMPTASMLAIMEEPP